MRLCTWFASILHDASSARFAGFADQRLCDPVCSTGLLRKKHDAHPAVDLKLTRLECVEILLTQFCISCKPSGSGARSQFHRDEQQL